MPTKQASTSRAKKTANALKVQAPPVISPARARSLARLTVVLWLVAATMVACIVPLLFAGTSARADVQKISGDLQSARATFARISTPPSEIQKLASAAWQVETQIAQLNVVSPTLSARRTDWGSVMMAVGGYDPTFVAMTTITRTENRLLITGLAARENDVTTYAESLDRSGLFSRVIVQSLQVVSGTAGSRINVAPDYKAVPDTSSRPTQVTTNNTSSSGAQSDGRDSFEPDDAKTPPLSLGLAQRRNFYPDPDVDTGNFLAKTGRTYHVYTTESSPGVDTLLSLTISGLSYTNDDAKAGTLNSDIVFTYSGSDAYAQVNVSNRGQYSVDKWYKLMVEELVPTPTSTPQPIVVPAATSTLAPTNIPTSTPTRTATPTKTATPTSTNTQTSTLTKTATPTLTNTPVTPTKTATPTVTNTPVTPTKTSSLRGVPLNRFILGWNSSSPALAIIAKEPPTANQSLDVSKSIKFTILLEIRAFAP